MLDITVRRDGRSWFGRKLYRVDLRSRTGTMDVRHLTPVRAAEVIGPILTKMITEERPFSVTDQDVPPTTKFGHD